ncbi:MAG: Bug family tripartite tricarboxylate transporter substrate binding protein [Burkholderiales bacterium]
MIEILKRSSASALMFSLALLSINSIAQSYPSKPIRLVVPFTAGSGPDITARLVTNVIPQGLGQPVIVDNRVGAGGRIAAEFVAKSPADGYTLLLGTASTHLVSPHLVKGLPYDPFKDFTPVTILITPATSVVVPASLPARTMGELIAYGKANPSKLAFGSNGVGSTAHLVGELLKMSAGIDMLHVPFKGSNEAMAALLAEHIQVYFSSPGPTRPHVQAGKMRLLAVLSPKRFAGEPQLPTLNEVLPSYEGITDWFGVFGAGVTPQPIVARLHSEIVKALSQPEVRSEFDKLTYIVVGNTPDEFSALMKREYQVYGKVIRSVNIPMQ